MALRDEKCTAELCWNVSIDPEHRLKAKNPSEVKFRYISDERNLRTARKMIRFIFTIALLFR